MSGIDFSILIVEDELLLVLSLQLAMNQAGYRIAGSASTLEEALLIAERDPPDLALVDIRLSKGQSGIDVAKALQHMSIRTLFMTGNKPSAPLPDLAVGCLSKPFSDKSLLSAIRVVRAKGAGDEIVETVPLELELY